MAINDATLYGRDLRCSSDADELFTDAVGLDIVRQDALHRMTQDDILGDDGTGSLVIAGWGYDVRKLLGAPQSRLNAAVPIIVDVLLRDERISKAELALDAVSRDGNLIDIASRLSCETKFGPFSIVKNVSDLTAGDLIQ